MDIRSILKEAIEVHEQLIASVGLDPDELIQLSSRRNMLLHQLREQAGDLMDWAEHRQGIQELLAREAEWNQALRRQFGAVRAELTAVRRNRRNLKHHYEKNCG